jgi:hypothetical protein
VKRSSIVHPCIATRLGIAGEVLHALSPKVAQIAMNTAFRMFPDSARPRAQQVARDRPSADMMAMAQLMRGESIYDSAQGAQVPTHKEI